jgi:hypothetical protein
VGASTSARGRCTARLTTLLLAWAVSLPAAMLQAAEFGPQGVVRQFCQVDALGLRVMVAGWPRVAPLVQWTLEPAWDQVALITGYTVSPPRRDDDGTFSVDVHYSVLGQLTADGLNTESRVETVTFHVDAPDERGWRIIGPPPPPHLFEGGVDVAAVQRSLARGSPNFLSNAGFVWRMYRLAGWTVTPQRTADLLTSKVYRPVEHPAAGDLVAYLREDRPYHVGILDAHAQVVSSTLNAGVVRSALNAFAGDVRYLRLVDPRSPDEVRALHAARVAPGAVHVVHGTKRKVRRR